MSAHPDPPVPTDGSCANCGQPRHPERSKRYGRHEAHLDPFCSTSCCRAWHHTELPVSSNVPGPRGYVDHPKENAAA